MRSLAAVLAAAVALPALSCKREAPEIDGYGDFHIGKSTLADGYVCTPRGELTYCSNNPSPPLAGHRTDTDLYFRGTGDDAPLVEILVTASACDPAVVERELIEQLGQPDTDRDALRVWEQKSAKVVARLPAEPALCELIFLAPGETERFAQLTGAGTGAAQR